MDIRLNVNDLVEQLINFANQQSEAVKQANEMKQKVQDLERKVMDFELAEYKAKLDLERDLENMALEYSEKSVSSLSESLLKLASGK